jgi:DNA-directed RNA polymerase subunit M/transcription elongation factor TFIIS
LHTNSTARSTTYTLKAMTEVLRPRVVASGRWHTELPVNAVVVGCGMDQKTRRKVVIAIEQAVAERGKPIATVESVKVVESAAWAASETKAGYMDLMMTSVSALEHCPNIAEHAHAIPAMDRDLLGDQTDEVISEREERAKQALAIARAKQAVRDTNARSEKKCPRCRNKSIHIDQVQTRGGDEGKTVFEVCMHEGCNYKTSYS